MYLLSVDSSTRYCSVAIHHDGAEIFSANNLIEKSASSVLTFLIQAATEAVGIELADIDAFSVGKGPGSYTGLRVATSVVKGLCFALDKPIIGVNTLEAMALSVRRGMAVNLSDTGTDRLLFAPMIDARRMEVYCALYDIAGKNTEPTQAVIVENESFDRWLSHNRIIFFGDGADKCRPLLEQKKNVFFWNETVHPTASGVGELAYAMFLRGEREEAVDFEPFYLKEFQGIKKGL